MDANDQHAIEIAIAAVVSESPSAPEQQSAPTQSNAYIVSEKGFKKIIALSTASNGVTTTVLENNEDTGSDRLTLQGAAGVSHGYVARFTKAGTPLPDHQDVLQLEINTIKPTFMIVTDTLQPRLIKPEESEPGIHLEIYHIPDDNNKLFYVKHLNPQPTAP